MQTIPSFHLYTDDIEMRNTLDNLRCEVCLDEFLTAEAADASLGFVPIGAEQDKRNKLSQLDSSIEFKGPRLVSVTLFRWHLRSKDRL